MLTYQVRPRVLMVEAGALTFPNRVEIELKFNPDPAFGGESPAGRTVRTGSSARLEWDANRGRGSVSGQPSLNPLDVQISGATFALHLNGTTLRLEFECADRATLLGTLGSLRYLLPLLLNLEFSDPPVVAMSFGRVGGVEFNWQVEWTAASFESVDQDAQEAKIPRAWQRLSLVADGGSARLRAALYYFYKACRLERVGSGHSEFLAEVLLNLAKTLEALFPVTKGEGSRDSVRKNLQRLGYNDDEAENYFLPAMALRDELDVAHISLAGFEPGQLGTIFRYAESAEQHFRDLLQRILAATIAGSFTLEPYKDTGPRREATVLLKRLAERSDPTP